MWTRDFRYLYKKKKKNYSWLNRIIASATEDHPARRCGTRGNFLEKSSPTFALCGVWCRFVKNRPPHLFFQVLLNKNIFDLVNSTNRIDRFLRKIMVIMMLTLDYTVTRSICNGCLSNFREFVPVHYCMYYSFTQPKRWKWVQSLKCNEASKLDYLNALITKNTLMIWFLKHNTHFECIYATYKSHNLTDITYTVCSFFK